MGVSRVVCCQVRGLRDELITRPEGSYRLWCVAVCDLETSRLRSPWPVFGRSATGVGGAGGAMSTRSDNSTIYRQELQKVTKPDLKMVLPSETETCSIHVKALNGYTEFKLCHTEHKHCRYIFFFIYFPKSYLRNPFRRG